MKAIKTCLLESKPFELFENQVLENGSIFVCIPFSVAAFDFLRAVRCRFTERCLKIPPNLIAWLAESTFSQVSHMTATARRYTCERIAAF